MTQFLCLLSLIFSSIIFSNLAYADTDETTLFGSESPFYVEVGGGFYSPLEEENLKFEDTIVNYGELSFGFQTDLGVESYVASRYINDNVDVGVGVGYLTPVSDLNSIYFSGGIYYNDKMGALPNASFGFLHELDNGLSLFMESTAQSISYENQILFGIGLRLGGGKSDEAAQEPVLSLPANDVIDVVKEPRIEPEGKKPKIEGTKSDCSQEHIMREGEWIWKVAKAHKLSPRNVVELNKSDYPNLDFISVGDSICLKR